ncbi:MAG: hypothetical protein MZV64_49115 [Ignavibacteriales bacterium]|nr:hypothetical protein [Ignavibacteriales bacterium]
MRRGDRPRYSTRFPNVARGGRSYFCDGRGYPIPCKQCSCGRYRTAVCTPSTSAASNCRPVPTSCV